MPIDTSIYGNIKQPQQYSLGDIMGLATSAQNLQTGKIRQQREGVGLEQDTANLSAQKAIGAVVSDPQYHDPDTGLFDLNAAAPAIIQADPQDRFSSKVISDLAKANADLITVKKASLGLADNSRALLGSTVGALATKTDLSKADITESLNQLKAQAPDAKPIIDVWERGLANLPDDPKALQGVVMKARSQVMPPTAQIESQTPGGASFNTGAVSGVLNVKPTAGPAGPVPGTLTQNVVGPAAAETVGTDVAGNPIRVVKSPTGVISLEPITTAGGAANAPGGGPGAPKPMYSFPPGESPQTKAALEGERQQAQTTLSQAPILHATNRGVLEEIDKTAATGAAGPRIQYLLSTLGAKFSTPEEKASAYDLVGKYLERNALQAAQGMGPNTNAGLDAQIKANGSLGYNPTAIKKITKLNDAIVSGVEAYQPGLEKAIQGSPNQIFAKRQFDQQWAQNFDPRVMQINNAVKAGDKAELADLTRGLSPAERKELARKAQAIELLSSQGRL